jgi:universal stress protein A
MSYKNILFATDLHPDSHELILERALDFVKQYQAKLSIIHVVEHMTYGLAQAYPAAISLEEEIRQEAQKELDQLIQKYKLQDVDIMIESGSPKILIIEMAKTKNVDLIVVGSHGRHGLELLLGSTANAVLHHAPCDVLAVRLKN